MTVLGKTLFSLLLVGGGFMLASVFGPPELADQLAEQLTPGRQADPWGDLRPAAPGEQNDPRWAPLARAGLQPVDRPPAFARTPIVQSEPPAPTRYPSDEPSWLRPSPTAWPDAGPPTLEIAGQPADAPAATGVGAFDRVPGGMALRDTAVQPAAAVSSIVGDRYTQPAPWPAPAGASGADAGSPTPWQAAKPASTPPAATPQAAGWPTAAPQAPPWPAPASDPSAHSQARPAPSAGAWDQAVRQDPASANPVGFGPQKRDAAAPAERVASAQWGSPRDLLEPSAPRTHFVTDGDTLAEIARRYLGDAARAADVYAWNRQLLDHPELLPIGVALRVDEPREDALRETGASEGLMSDGSTNPANNAPVMVRVGAPGPGPPTGPRARLLAPQPAGGFAGAYGPR